MNKWINILISIDDQYVIHAKDLIRTLAEKNPKNKFNIYLIYDETLGESSIRELNYFIECLDCGTLKTYFFNDAKEKFPMHIDYITQNTYYRLFAPYIIEEDIDRLLYLDCDIICNGEISEFYNQSFDDNIFVACQNITPLYLKAFFNERISYLNLQKDETYVNAGVLLINVKAYKNFISSDSIYEYIKQNKDQFIFQDQDIINSLFRDNIKLGDIIYNYQINVIDWGLDMKNCRLIHYSEANKPWNNVSPNFKRYLHYYKYLYEQDRKNELRLLLQKQYNNFKYYYEYIEKLQNFNEIDIIIPVYNSKKYLHKALDSILNQTYKDMRVYIIDDASTEDYSEILNQYDTLDIFYKKLEKNMGPGIARQVGIDNSFGNYIIFLDSDDIFYNEKSVEILHKAIKNADVVTSQIYEETEEVIYANENIGLHGKIYRRAFLEQNEIKFTMARLNEDTYFNELCELNGARYNNIKELTYIWCDNSTSITRKNKKEHIDKDIVSYCTANVNAIKKYLENNENININTLLINLTKSIILIADKYRICSYKIEEEVYDRLNQLLCIYNKIDNLNNLNKYIENDEIRELYEINKSIILKNAKSKTKISNYNDEDKEEKNNRVNLVDEYNKTSVYEQEKRIELIKTMFNNTEGNCIIEPPFHACWGGKNVSIKNGAYLSFNCTMIDDGNIEIGYNTIIGPNVTISTTNHPLEAQDRLNGTLKISDVKIGNNVWIGAGTIILPGVTIGDNSVIGAGSIVTKDIPSNVLAYGNPCKVIKTINN